MSMSYQKLERQLQLDSINEEEVQVAEEMHTSFMTVIPDEDPEQAWNSMAPAEENEGLESKKPSKFRRPAAQLRKWRDAYVNFFNSMATKQVVGVAYWPTACDLPKFPVLKCNVEEELPSNPDHAKQSGPHKTPDLKKPTLKIPEDEIVYPAVMKLGGRCTERRRDLLRSSPRGKKAVFPL